MISDNKNNNIKTNNLERDLTELKDLKKNLFHREDRRGTDSFYFKRKLKDLIEIRRKKLKELYENEIINLKYEMISGKNIKKEFEFLIDDNIKYSERSKIVSDSNNRQDRNVTQFSQSTNCQNYSDNTHSNDKLIPQNSNYYPLPKINPLANNQQILIKKNPQYQNNSNIDNSIKLQLKNLENLKLEDFYSRKKLQDDLLDKIRKQMEKLRFGINDKYYQEKLANDWYEERKKN